LPKELIRPFVPRQILAHHHAAHRMRLPGSIARRCVQDSLPNKRIGLRNAVR